MPHEFWCIDVLTCVIYNVGCRENYGRRQVGEYTDTWYKRIQPAETVELYVAAWQQRLMGFRTLLLVFHINIGVTLNSLFVCVLVVDVELY